jgi:hypothetical protein
MQWVGIIFNESKTMGDELCSNEENKLTHVKKVRGKKENAGEARRLVVSLSVHISTIGVPSMSQVLVWLT